MIVFRSLVIPLQAAVMNLLSIGASLGVIVAIFQWGWLGGLFGVQQGPIESFIPVMLFAIVFGLSMDYEVFLVSRMHERWVRTGDDQRAVQEGLALTGRVVTAAAAIMVCVFLSFMLGEDRIIKEFGLSLASAVFLDALVDPLPAAARGAHARRSAHVADPRMARPAAAARQHRGRHDLRHGSARGRRHRTARGARGARWPPRERTAEPTPRRGIGRPGLRGAPAVIWPAAHASAAGRSPIGRPSAVVAASPTASAPDPNRPSAVVLCPVRPASSSRACPPFRRGS